MVTKAVSAAIVTPVELPDVIDGNYKGEWSGYTVKANVWGEDIVFQVDTGVRGIGIPCMVHVKNGSIEVEAL